MRTLKGWITTTCLVTMLMVSTAAANTGIIIGGRNQPQQPTTPCTVPAKDEAKIDMGIIIGGVGIIIGGLTGIIIGGVADDSPVDCGIIIGG
jgi:hypothetical protein